MGQLCTSVGTSEEEVLSEERVAAGEVTCLLTGGAGRDPEVLSRWGSEAR